MKFPFAFSTLVVISSFAMPAALNGQSPVAAFGEAKELPLYPGVAPGSEKWDYSENVTQGKSGPQLKNVRPGARRQP